MVKKSRLIEILESFSQLKIAVIGDVMLDDYIIGNVDKISPEAPVPVVNVQEEKFVLGGAANVLNNLQSLGVEVFSYGIIGKDKNGDRLLNEFSNKNINTKGIIISNDRPTIVKKRVIANNQQLLRIDWEDKKDLTKEFEDNILTELKENIAKLDAIILSDYDKGVLTKRLAVEIIKLAKEHNKIITVDPKPKNAKNYVGATSMTPNRKEALACLGLESTEDYNKLGKQIKKELNLKNLLLTKSEDGMSLFLDIDGKSEIKNIPTFAKEVYDVTGAGDTVISVFTAAAASGASWEECAKIANAAAGIVVGRVGTSVVKNEEILEFYDKLYHEQGL